MYNTHTCIYVCIYLGVFMLYVYMSASMFGYMVMDCAQRVHGYHPVYGGLTTHSAQCALLQIWFMIKIFVCRLVSDFEPALYFKIKNLVHTRGLFWYEILEYPSIDCFDCMRRGKISNIIKYAGLRL